MNALSYQQEVRRNINRRGGGNKLIWWGDIEQEGRRKITPILLLGVLLSSCQ
jgi:hypothetical protein